MDQEVNDIILFIFKQSLEGKGAGAIRKMLTDSGCCGWNMNVTEVKIKTTDGSVIGSKRYLVCGGKVGYGEENCRGNSISYDDLVEVLLIEINRCK